MRLSTRHSITLGATLVCLLLCVAVVSQAFAAGGVKEHPHITVTPHHIFTDINGCGSVRVSGTGFAPSTQTAPNFAELDVSDSEGGAFWQNSGLTATYVPVDALGRFSAVETVCEPFLVPGDTFTICGYDFDPGVDANCVNVRAS
jgi:hypothetical protein